MQSLSGTIKSNKHDGLHMQFMSFAAGCMCALSGPNGLGIYSFFFRVLAISWGQPVMTNGYRRPTTPAQNHSATLLKFFLAIAFRFPVFFFFCTLPPCNLWAREVEMASPVACGASVEYWGTLS